MRLTADHDIFRRSVRDFVDRRINPFVDQWELDGMFPAHDLFGEMGRAGLLGITYDPEYGGQGADISFNAVFGEEIGRIRSFGVSMALSVQTDMATPAIHKFGSHELKLKYLKPALAGEMVAAVGVTEPDAGSDVAGIRTRAVRDGDDWVINGSKLYITNGIQADWICLLARTSPGTGYTGMSQIIVPTDSPGFAVSRKLDKLGNRSSDTAELSLVDCRVPVANTVGEEGRGFQQQMAQFQPERLIASFMAVGQCSWALDETIAYVNSRTAFGQPLSANQHIQFTLAEIRADIEMLRALVYRAADLAMEGEDVTYYATIAKLKAGRLLRRTADAAMQFHGGLGYMEEHWTARYFRDSRLCSIGGGADEVMLRILAGMEGIGGKPKAATPVRPAEELHAS
jgi:citronellyl-CoA dehydrogenase